MFAPSGTSASSPTQRDFCSSSACSISPGCRRSQAAPVLLQDPLVDLALDHDPYELGIEPARLRFRVQNVQRLVGLDCGLVRTIRRSERVEHVGDGHDARLDRNLLAPELSRIPGAIQLFMMTVGVRDQILQIIGPWNTNQKAEGR